MNWCYFSFPSLTHAQNALFVLEECAIYAKLTQAPMTAQSKGCAHALQIRAVDINRASRLLKARNVHHFHIYQFLGGKIKEVLL